MASAKSARMNDGMAAVVPLPPCGWAIFAALAAAVGPGTPLDVCDNSPKCRHDHRPKQHPRWHVDQLPDGTFRWTAPSGRQYTTEPTRYPI